MQLKRPRTSRRARCVYISFARVSCSLKTKSCEPVRRRPPTSVAVTYCGRFVCRRAEPRCVACVNYRARAYTGLGVSTRMESVVRRRRWRSVAAVLSLYRVRYALYAQVAHWAARQGRARCRYVHESDGAARRGTLSACARRRAAGSLRLDCFDLRSGETTRRI